MQLERKSENISLYYDRNPKEKITKKVFYDIKASKYSLKEKQ